MGARETALFAAVLGLLLVLFGWGWGAAIGGEFSEEPGVVEENEEWKPPVRPEHRRRRWDTADPGIDEIQT